jgi:hypothetical protein
VGEPGELRLRAVAEHGGEALGEDGRTVEVVEPVGELTGRRKAGGAGGDRRGDRRGIPADQPRRGDGGLLPLEPESEARVVHLRPARTWWFFALVLAVAAADWLLRRRWGVG